VELELYTSAFCGACAHARAVLAQAERLIPDATVTEFDVVRHEDRAVAEDITATPTVIVRDAGGAEVFRASGAPTLAQVIVAAAKAV
jgi:hypothetical protein